MLWRSIILPPYVPNPYYLKFSAISTVFWVTSWVTLIMKDGQTLLKENSIMLFFLFRYLICFRILYKWTDDVILQHQGKISTTFFTFFIRKILVKYLWTTTADPYREIHDIYKIYVALRSCSLSAGNLCSDTNGSWFESDRLVCAEVRSLQ